MKAIVLPRKNLASKYATFRFYTSLGTPKEASKELLAEFLREKRNALQVENIKLLNFISEARRRSLQLRNNLNRYPSEKKQPISSNIPTCVIRKRSSLVEGSAIVSFTGIVESVRKGLSLQQETSNQKKHKNVPTWEIPDTSCPSASNATPTSPIRHTLPDECCILTLRIPSFLPGLGTPDLTCVLQDAYNTGHEPPSHAVDSISHFSSSSSRPNFSFSSFSLSSSYASFTPPSCYGRAEYEVVRYVVYTFGVCARLALQEVRRRHVVSVTGNLHTGMYAQTHARAQVNAYRNYCLQKVREEKAKGGQENPGEVSSVGNTIGEGHAPAYCFPETEQEIQQRLYSLPLEYPKEGLPLSLTKTGEFYPEGIQPLDGESRKPALHERHGHVIVSHPQGSVMVLGGVTREEEQELVGEG